MAEFPTEVGRNTNGDIGNLKDWNMDENMITNCISKLKQELSGLAPKLIEQSNVVCNIQEHLIKMESLLVAKGHVSFNAELVSAIRQYSESSVTSLDEYIKQNLESSKINVGLNSLQIQLQMTFNKIVSQTENSLFLILFDLCYYLTCLQYQRKVDFANFVLTKRSELRSILFANIPLTKEAIESHAKKLFVLFDPDKYEPEQKAKFIEVLQLITDDVNQRLETRTKDSILVKCCKESGKKYVDIANAYKDRRKHEGTNVEWANHQHYYAIIAYKTLPSCSKRT
jgi:hypothetical protein